MGSGDDFLFVNDMDEDSIVLKEWNKARNPIYYCALLAFALILFRAFFTK